MAAPNPVAERLTVRTDIEVRRADRSAPRSEPTLTTDISSEKVRSCPSRSRTANRGSTVWKLKASVPMTAIMMSGTRSSSTRQA